LNRIIHFVYSVPGINEGFYLKVISKLNKYLSLIGLGIPLIANNKRDSIITNKWPLRSPYEVTKNVYNKLITIDKTRLYHLHEKNRIKFTNDDIFLGHPHFPQTNGVKSVTEYAIQSKVRPKKLAIITPLHCNTSINTRHINKEYLNHIDNFFPNIDILFGIMGEYWWDQWDNSPYSHWKSKMVRLDMAINSAVYEKVKFKFSEKNQRKFLFIGINDPTKGVSYLSELAKSFSYGTFGWVGSGSEIKNVYKESDFRNLDSNFMRKIAMKYDFIISPSFGDANPTTILEAMCWGFPVVCTPQSGYYEDSYRFIIKLDDINQSIKILKNLQNMSDENLNKISVKARAVVQSEYTWKKFTSTIIDHLNISE